MRKGFVTLGAVVAAFASAQDARADGLPVLGVDAGGVGVLAPSGQFRYVAVAARSNTVLVRLRVDGGEVVASRALPGRFAVPVVAYDGTAAGISGDGRTLVLVRPRRAFPRARTELVILDARRLQVRSRVRLRGDFSFDAVTPDGSLLYLIEYVSRRDPTRYQVRAYDVRRERLLPEPVIDPLAFGKGPMRGNPLSRASSGDGRWAYTLYDGANGDPFIHALDTVTRKAACIDLPLLAGRADLSELRLTLGGDGREIVVAGTDGPKAIVDAATYEVSEPPVAAPPPAPAPETPPAAAEDRAPRAWWALGAVPLALMAGLMLRRRRGGGGREATPLAGAPDGGSAAGSNGRTAHAQPAEDKAREHAVRELLVGERRSARGPGA